MTSATLRGNSAIVRPYGSVGIRGTHERQSLLDGTDARLMEMLVRAGSIAEPGIIGNIEQPAGRLLSIPDCVGEYDLVADQCDERWDIRR